MALVVTPVGPAGAARLMGGVEALNAAVGLPLVVPFFQASPERAVELARTRLGEEAFAAAWAEGRATPYAEIMADALSVGEPSASKPALAGEERASWAPLSPHEREVAALIARGFTNPQIAETLVLSRLTAGTHVRNITRRLGVASRAQVASWAASQQRVAPPSPTARD